MARAVAVVELESASSDRSVFCRDFFFSWLLRGRAVRSCGLVCPVVETSYCKKAVESPRWSLSRGSANKTGQRSSNLRSLELQASLSQALLSLPGFAVSRQLHRVYSKACFSEEAESAASLQCS